MSEQQTSSTPNGNTADSETTYKEAVNKRMEHRYLELLGQDAELQAMMPKSEVFKSASEAGLSGSEVIDRILSGYAERPALGMRDYKISPDAKTGNNVRHYHDSFTTIRFEELRQRIRNIASAWANEPSLRVEVDDFVCVMGFASTDFAALDIACAYAQTVCVPLQSATAGADLDEIFANVNPAALAASTADLHIAAGHAVTHGNIRSLIVFDYEPADANDRAEFDAAAALLAEAGLSTRLISLDELVAIGQSQPWDFLPAHPQAAERLATIIHSSGSTGKPKGAMLSEASVIHAWIGKEDPFPGVAILFAPLNHLMGRIPVINNLRKGSVGYFTLKPDMSTLFDDIRLVRPTSLIFFPRVLEQIHQHYQNEVSRRAKPGDDLQAIRDAVQAEMRGSYLGDRVVAAVVGAAPTSPAVKRFMEDCFEIRMIEGYGSTEAGSGSVTMDNKIQRDYVTDFKLLDVPELGYFTTDKPWPRGELCFKSKNMVKGYYKQPEATAGLLDDEGFALTGDIVEQRGPDEVVVIDRRKDVLKLSQGEYVAVGRLGTVFEANSAVIKQIYIYGNSLRAYLLAVVVPDAEAVKTVLGKTGGINNENTLRQLIRSELQNVCRNAGLRSFEVPRDFIIEHEAFTQENGLLSSVRKRLRPALKAKYGEQLEAIYIEHEQRQLDELQALKDPHSPLSTLQKVGKLLEAELSIEIADLNAARSFEELGGDSLAAVSFSASISEVFAVTLPADSILNPTGNPKRWADEIDRRLSGTNIQPDFDQIHGRGATQANADDLTLLAFLGEASMQAAAKAAPMGATTHCVLLTGANGFLGRQLCLQWMEKLVTVNGKLICLIRADNDAAARAKLDASFATASPELQQHYQQLAETHLQVLAGDAGQPLLGLNQTAYEQLAAQVDRICHVAALVNHRLGYEHQFGPNVVGTAEVIRLALSNRKKAIDFMSTEAVLGFLDSSSGSVEDVPPLQQIPLSNDYAVGYAASKWAAEHLLRKANAEFGIAVNIMRGNMMLAHQHHAGQINTADMFTRLIYSVIVTGFAPMSFYQSAADGSRCQGHYNGLPVNTVAAATIAAADHNDDNCRAYNIMNYHHDDGCSLDAFVNWIEAAGYTVTRIDDYPQWFNRFQDKLNSLPDEQKQHSALDLLAAWAQPQRITDGSEVDCEQFRRLMDTKLGGELPHLDQAFLNKCLADIKMLGLIE